MILCSLGLFINNGVDLSQWRILGVLQYFGVSNFVVAATVLLTRHFTRREMIQHYTAGKSSLSDVTPLGTSDPLLPRAKVGDEETLFAEPITPAETTFVSSFLYQLRVSSVFLCYRYEWIIQVSILVLSLAINFGWAAPGCPLGYFGAGGISEDGEYQSCTGGIHRHIDLIMVGSKHFYQGPTCKQLYDCISYDPEGILGMLTAINLTYLGLMSGRVLLHFRTTFQRLLHWLGASLVLLLIAGCLCGFSQNDGIIPVNNNLWSTSFGVLLAGGALFMLSWIYVLVDAWNWWSGVPFLYLGMNSILIYVGSELLGDHFPFDVTIDGTDDDYRTHAELLTANSIGVISWMLVAYFCYRNKFFLKI